MILKKYDTWKIQSAIATINFMSSKDNDEECVMHSRDNIDIMINDKTDEVIEELFQSLLPRYQTGLKTSLKGSDFFKM